MTDEEKRRLLDLIDQAEQVILDEVRAGEDDTLIMKLAARIREAIRAFGPA